MFNSYCQMCWPHVFMTRKTNNTVPLIGTVGLIIYAMVNQYISSSNDRLWEPVTPLYLVHVSICPTSHSLNELEVMLRVPPLNFTAWPGKDIHGGLNQTILYI